MDSDIIYIHKLDLYLALQEAYGDHHDASAIKRGECTWMSFLRGCDLGISIKPRGDHHVVTDRKKFMMAQLKYSIRATNQTPA